ncbi:SDR family NAD(P)-dependent oxidoreductase [Ruegeria meonggei]|uniref:SDR family NAD(P)-dependent oxidoreductase n=1 Tax=Ruegeria meonggei TaxID=1446476 RepID=UPI00366F60B0
MDHKVCLITGVGDGTGASVARRFARDGYRVAMLARNPERLADLENELPGSKAFAFDLEDLDQLVSVCRQVKEKMGVPEVIVHNAVRATFKPFTEADPEELERNFRVNTTSLLYMARELTPAMVERGSGAIIITGNTAALRGVPNYALFAPTKAAQRIFAQSLARELGPKGIHVAYVVIDAAIDTPWTRVPFNPDMPEEFFSKPDAIAAEVFHIAHQDRSTWSFDVELRPYGEKW